MAVTTGVQLIPSNAGFESGTGNGWYGSGATYVADTAYALNATVVSSGIYYRSLQVDNTGHTPADSPTWWAVVLNSDTIFYEGTKSARMDVALTSQSAYQTLWSGDTAFERAGYKIHVRARIKSTIADSAIHAIAAGAEVYISFASTPNSTLRSYLAWDRPTTTVHGNQDWMLMEFSGRVPTYATAAYLYLSYGGVQTWSSAVTYATNTIVQNSGSLWKSLIANTNVTPVEGATWTAVASIAGLGSAWFDDVYCELLEGWDCESSIAYPTYHNTLYSDSERKLIITSNVVDNTVPTYDATIRYALNAVVVSSGTYYRSVQANNTGNAVTNATWWAVVLAATLGTRAATACELYVTVGGSALAVKPLVNGLNTSEWSLASITAGTHEVVVFSRVIAAPTPALSTETFTLTVIDAVPPAIHVTNTGSLDAGDGAEFPLGVYNMWYSSGRDVDADLVKLAASPFTYVINYGGRSGYGTTAGQIVILDKCTTAGIKVIEMVDDRLLAPGTAATTVSLSTIIGALKGHSALVAWGINDENVAWCMDPQVIANHNTIVGLDAEHPVYGVLSCDYNDADSQANGYDIVAADPYPICNSQSITRAYLDILEITNTMRSNPMTVAVSEACVYESSGLYPSQAQMQCMAWQQIIAGARGLFWYRMDYAVDRTVDTGLGGQWTKLVAAANSLAQVKRYGLTANVASPNAVTCDNANVYIATRLLGNYALLVTNPTASSQACTFTLPVGWAAMEVRDVAADGSYTVVSSASSTFAATLTTLTSKLYEFHRLGTWTKNASVVRSTFSVSDPQNTDYTCPANTTLLVAMIAMVGGDPLRTGGAPTYNGVAMTLAKASIASTSFETADELWYLLNPSTGTYQLSIQNDGTKVISVTISSYISGAATGNALVVDSNKDTHSTSSSNPTSDLITGLAIGDLVVASLGSGDILASATATSPSTLLATAYIYGGIQTGGLYHIMSSGTSLAPAWVDANANDWVVLTAAFHPGSGQPTIIDIDPASTINVDTIDITINGYMPLPASMTAKLAKTGESDIAATILSYSASQLVCRFAVISAALGTWDLTVTNSVTSETVTTAFDIIQTAGNSVTVPAAAAATATGIAPDNVSIAVVLSVASSSAAAVVPSYRHGASIAPAPATVDAAGVVPSYVGRLAAVYAEIAESTADGVAPSYGREAELAVAIANADATGVVPDYIGVSVRATTAGATAAAETPTVGDLDNMIASDNPDVTIAQSTTNGTITFIATNTVGTTQTAMFTIPSTYYNNIVQLVNADGTRTTVKRRETTVVDGTFTGTVAASSANTYVVRSTVSPMIGVVSRISTTMTPVTKFVPRNYHSG